MKTLLALTTLIALCLPFGRAAETPVVAALQAADNERVAAMIAGDQARLDRILSDDLRYAHSNGAVDTKTSFIHSLDTGLSKYVAVDYEVRDFKAIADGVALMTGRAMFHLAPNGKPVSLHLGFLGVWRNEHGTWRFVAWQSCPVPSAPAPR